MLPDVLARAGRMQLQAGERAEGQSAARAQRHYQEAQSDFQGALDLNPQHQPAREGLATAEARLAGLRERTEQEAERNAQTARNLRTKTPSLQQLLGEVEESERSSATERQRQTARNQPNARRAYPDW